VQRTVLAGVFMVVILSASACGGGNNPTAEVLRSANPLTSDVYVRIRGPAGAVSYIAHELMTGSFRKYSFTESRAGFFVPPRVQAHRACSFTHTIGRADAPNLQQWRGRKTRIAIYGDKSYAAVYCYGLGSRGLYRSGS
jgi:hypothetical protein